LRWIIVSFIDLGCVLFLLDKAEVFFVFRWL
jgi:hypothetical protein